MIRERLYRLATALIVMGVVMLCQPFLFIAHTAAFPVLLVGIMLFMVLDHLPNATDHTT